MVAGEVDWAVQRERAARAAAREADFMVSMGDERKEGQRGWLETEAETGCISAYYLPIILVLSSVGDTVVIGEWSFAPATLRRREHVTTERLALVPLHHVNVGKDGEVELWGSGA